MHRSRIVRNVRLGIKNLSLHAMRSLLTILGVVFGVGSVIAMLSVGEGASREALDRLRKLGSNNIILTAVKPPDEQSATIQRSRMSMYGLLYDDEARIREGIPSVRRTVPAKQTEKDGRLGNRSQPLRIVGTTPEWFELVARTVIAGRVLSPQDIESHADVCVLTEQGARKLLATEHAIGQFVRISRDYFQIIGIVQSESAGGGSIQTPDQDFDAYIPVNVAKERFGDINIKRTAGMRSVEYVQLNQLLIEVVSSDKVEATAEAISTVLKRFHKKQDYKMEVPLTLLRQAEATKRTFNIVLGSIAGISLLVGGIGIMNIMLASVTERTREIGIRRAIGAKRRQIIVQFLIETVVLSTVGGIIGIVLGFLFPWLITIFFGMPTIVPAYSIVLSLGISVGVGIVFGLYPAVRAAGLDPIVALRHE
ncbi:MAG TPA: ABC transporter permease [Phycisphaerae bacterium]|nr:ABC transporter permease [Phycisphaerae bacterium]